MVKGTLYKVQAEDGTWKPDLPRIKKFMEEVFALGGGALLGPYKVKSDHPGELELTDYYGRLMIHHSGIDLSDYDARDLEGTMKMFAATPSVNARMLIMMDVLLDALEGKG